jgi:predicted amino acid-binding ACT domain protein
MLPAAEKIVLVLEGIGDDKIRINSSSLDNPVTILADQGIEIVGIEKKVMEGRTMRSAYWLNHDPILADQSIEIVGIEKKVMRTMRSAYWLNHDPSGLARTERAGRGGLRSDNVTGASRARGPGSRRTS